MKLKKYFSLILAAAIAMSAMTLPAAANDGESADVLFSDDFEGYPTNASGVPLNRGQRSNVASYKTDKFVLTEYSGENGASDYDKFMERGSFDRHIQFSNDKNVGSGKAMTVTSQACSQYSGIIKGSNITKEKINGKKLVFSIDFKVNRMFYGEGYGVWLASYDESNNNKIVPDQMENRTPQAATTQEAVNKQLLAVAPDKKVDIDSTGINTSAIPLYAFGQQIGSASVGVPHTYTLELTPNGNGGYKAQAKLDGNALSEIKNNVPTEKEVVGCEYVMMSPIVHRWCIVNGQFGIGNIKDTEAKTVYKQDIDIITLDNLKMMAEEAEVTIIRADINDEEANVLKVSFVNENTNEPVAVNEILPNDIRIDNNAAIDKVVMKDGNTSADIYLTDTNADTVYGIEFTVSTPDGTSEKTVNYNYASPETKRQEVFTLFKDDFEGYPTEGLASGLPLEKGKDAKPESYDSDIFKFSSTASEGVNYSTGTDKDYFTYGSLKDHVKFENGSIGSGKVLKIFSQGYVNWMSMIKRSNVTPAKIADKDIVFSLDFMVDRMFLGEGYGVWLSETNSKNGELSPLYVENYWPSHFTYGDKTDGVLPDNEISDKKKQLIAIAPTGWQKIEMDGSGKNIEPIPVYAFGQKVGEVTAGQSYNYRLELTPDGNGSYNAKVKLTQKVGDVNLETVRTVEDKTCMPTEADFVKYKHILMSPMVHQYNIWHNQFEQDKSNKYENGTEIIQVDNAALYSTKHFDIDTTKGKDGVESLNSYGEISMTDKKITLVMNCDVLESALDKSKFSIDNGAEIKNVTSSGSRVEIELDKLSPSTEYKITAGGIFNKALCEYSGDFKLKTSSGVDIAPIKLNGDNKLNIGDDNKVEVTINKQGSYDKTITPSVLAVVYKKSGDDYVWRKTYCSEPKALDTTMTVTLDSIEIQEGDKLNVFVWGDLTDMDSLTNMTEFK